MATDPRYKMPIEKRKFGGKIYNYLIAGTKAECEKDADRQRAKGFLARVIKWRERSTSPNSNIWAVYVRRS